ncbi:MAG: hypothetical protein KDN19_18450 [Verrucomicrobiae bacterium]|nr:hypothetical protein [Verrucomicrobiae bacterium]
MTPIHDPLPRLGIRRRDVIATFGSRSLYEDCVRAGWLRPLVRRGRLTLFDASDVEKVWMRIKKGEVPPHGET